MTTTINTSPSNFIRRIIDDDIKQGKNQGRVATRFPPEPNGYLHIGHAKAICLNFGIAKDYNGTCNLRFDDTNPVKEDEEFMRGIETDIKWLGFEWHNGTRFTSDYFDKLYEAAVQLVKQGKAYVDSLSADEIREFRGTLKEPGKNSPYRNRSVEENLSLLERMKNGEFPDGSHVLRAKIDMSSPNINMRDPTIYRIRRAPHFRTGSQWSIYPMYDYAHCISDAIEGITHSLCSLEFEDHRPLYDWFLDQLDMPCHPQQIEFARLNVNFTVTSKRKLKRLVDEKIVDGWDDPRMPTLAGMRRRGYPAASIRNFCDRIGVTKAESIVDVGMLEHAVREELDRAAPRAMAVLRPLRVVLENYPEDRTEDINAPVHPQNPDMGERTLKFSKVLYIEQDDFMENPPKKYFRLSPGQEVRLRNAYVIKCNDVVRDNRGEIIELRCSYDPDTLGRNPEGRKVKGIIHWVSESESLAAEVRLYDRLFATPNPAAVKEGGDFLDNLNPQSLEVLGTCRVEPGLRKAKPGDTYQFERLGYFNVDLATTKDRLVINRTVTLRDSWAKIENKPDTTP